MDSYSSFRIFYTFDGYPKNNGWEGYSHILYLI